MRAKTMLMRLHNVLKTIRDHLDRQAAIRELSALNDHQLADIGVERGSLVEAVSGRLVRGGSN